MPLVTRLPGTRTTFIGETPAQVAPSLAETVCVPGGHSWGPLGGDRGGSKLIRTPLEFDALYGNDDTPLRRAVTLALNGQGPNSGGGAGAVLVYRMATGSAAQASHVFQNTAATPAAAVTFKAKYPGVRGNRISVDVNDDALDVSRDEILVLFDGVVQERYSYVPTDLVGLANQIEARSGLVTLTVTVNGTALNSTGGASALTGGANGDTLDGAAYAAALAVLSTRNFGILVFPDLTDASLRAAAVQWVKDEADAQRPVRFVIGGGSTDDLSTALTRSSAIGSELVINLGLGIYHDDLLDLDLTTAQLAPRLAGTIAANGVGGRLTFARLGGLYAVSGAPDPSEVYSAVNGGVTVLSAADAPDAELHIEMAVTTFTQEGVIGKPTQIFSDPRLVGINNDFIRTMKRWGDLNLVGTEIDQDARDAVRVQARSVFESYERQGLIMPGSGFVETPAADPQAEPNELLYRFGWAYSPTLLFLDGVGRVR